MKKRHIEATQEEVDIIDHAGADNLLRITRKYDDVAIHVIEEQARAKKELGRLRHCLRFWEAGIKRVVPLLIISGLVTGGIGWFCSDWIVQKIITIGLPARFWISATCVTLTAAAINTFDTGRLLIWHRKHTYQEEEEEPIAELLGAPCFDEEIGEWATSRELVKRLEISQSPIELGRDLTRLGYKKKHTNAGNIYLINKKDQ